MKSNKWKSCSSGARNEMGGVKVYETAIGVRRQRRPKKEWEEYLEQTREHARPCESFARRSSSTPDRPRADRPPHRGSRW